MVEEKLEWTQGDTQLLTISYQDETTKEVLDLRGWSFFFTVKENKEDDDDKIVVSNESLVSSDIEINPDKVEKVQIILDTEGTNKLIFGTDYHYGLQVITNAGHKKTTHTGTIKVGWKPRSI